MAKIFKFPWQKLSDRNQKRVGQGLEFFVTFSQKSEKLVK